MNSKGTAFAAFLALLSAPALLADTDRENDTPRFIQTTTSPGIDQLPDDGGSFCVPSSTTMLMYYLTKQGFDRLSAGWNYQNPNDPQNLANAYNLDRVLAGLVHTTPYAGTSPENWIAGVELYTGLMGYSNTGTIIGQTLMGSVNRNFSDVAESISSTNQAAILLVSWYNASGQSQSGHAMALVNASTSGAMSVTVHNPEPASTITGKSDTPGNSQQHFPVTLRSGASDNTLPDGLYIDTPNNPLPRYGQIASLLTIEMAESTISAPPAPYSLNGVTTIGTNGGNLTAHAPLLDGTSAGGITKAALGTLTLIGTNSTTGANTVLGGVLASTLTSNGSTFATPFGQGDMSVQSGATLLIQPTTATNGHAQIAVAGSPSGKFQFAKGLATLALDKGGNSQLDVDLGNHTDAGQIEHGTLFISPGVALSALGNSVTIQALGTEGMLDDTIDSKMVSPAIVGVDLDNTLAFLNYGSSGFVVAETQQNSFADGGNKVVEITSLTSVSHEEHALALIANASLTSGDPSSRIRIGATGNPGGLIVNNGADISVSKIDFSQNAYIHAGGSGTSTITSAISADTLVLSTTSTSQLELTDSLANVSSIKINGGEVSLSSTGADIEVREYAVLNASGTLSGSITARPGSAVHLANATIAGGLTLADNSEAFHDTWVPGATLEGTGTVKTTGATQTIGGIIGSETESGEITFENQSAGADITIHAPLQFALASLESNSTGGVAGTDWSSINFTGDTATLFGGTKSTVNIQINFATEGLVPNPLNPFWTNPQSWNFLTFAPGITIDANLNWRLSDQNIFSFAEAGQFAFSNDGVLTWTPLPEPSTWVLAVSGIVGVVIFARKRAR
jgi:hypothetical protein